MPFYEYECQACKFYTEVMQKITDAPLLECPSCHKRTLKKLVSAPVFRLKGGGWYETDFKSDKEEKRNLHGPDKEEAKAKAEGKAEGKAEAKADAKADGKAEAKEAKPAKEAKEAKEAKPAASRTTRRARTTARPVARGKSARAKSTRRTRR